MTPRRTLATAALGLTSLALATGCPGPATILSAQLQNPTPRVGETTRLNVQAMANWFRNPQYYYRAERGRLTGANGETAGQLGGTLRAGNIVNYSAPYTSRYPDPAGTGIRTNDRIEITVQDFTFSTSYTLQVNVVGSSVVFTQNDGQSGQNGLLMLATDSNNGQISNPMPLNDLAGRELRGSSPVISPNGTRIAYVQYPGDGTSKIWVRDASGQTMGVTNFPKGLAVDPSWSPDGAFLVFASNHETPDGTFDLYMMNIDQALGGQAVTRITNNTWDDRHPAWNPNPAAPAEYKLAVVSRKNGLFTPGSRQQNWNIFAMNMQGAYTKDLSSLAGDGENWAVEPAWRPDGNAIAYTRYGPVNSFQSSAQKFQRIFVQEINQSPTFTPLNPSNSDPNARESSPIWATDRLGDVLFLSSQGAPTTGGGRVFRTTYTGAVPGGGQAGAFFPQLLAPLQAMTLPITRVDGTNRDIFGYHPIDWR